MTHRNHVHIVPHNGDWVVERENSARVSSIHHTQAEAIEAGRPAAQRDHTELVIHRPNGQIRDSISYGNDPCPPHDKR